MRDKLVRKIKHKQAEIQELRDKVARLQDEIKLEESYLKALEDMYKLIDRGTHETEPRADFSLKEGSDLAKVRDILKDAGKPLHVKEIMGRMGKKFDPKIRASLVGSLGQYVRAQKIFNRPGPNVFGLMESAESGEKSVEPEPASSAPAPMRLVL